jgi:hypothetical protein
MNPKHLEWLANERGAEFRREAANSRLLARSRDSATDRRWRVFVRRSAKTWLGTALLALRVVRPTPSLETPPTPTP